MLTITFITAFAVLASALPKSSPKLSNFLLVTTSQRTPTHNSSRLANVSATSLFDPLYQTDYLLRLTAPGYGVLPCFNLTNGDLHTAADGPHGIGQYVYNSTGILGAGDELELAPAVELNGNLGLKSGYLLTVGGEETGWTVCDGALGEQVVRSKSESYNWTVHGLTLSRSTGRVTAPAAHQHTSML